MRKTAYLWAIFAALAAAGRADTLTVTSAADDGPGSLRRAIDDAGAGDLVDFDLPGPPPWTITVTSALTLDGETLTIRGPGADLLTVSGGGTTRVFSLVDTSLSLERLTVANGFALGTSATDRSEGGGLRLEGSSLALSDCRFVDNTAQGAVVLSASSALGGAIFYLDSGVLIHRCLFARNQALGHDGLGGAGLGGAIAMSAAEGDSLQIVNSTFSGNAARGGDAFAGPGGGLGGAIWIDSDAAEDLQLIYVTVADNHASGGLDLEVHAGDIEGAAVSFSSVGGTFFAVASLMTGNTVDGAAAGDLWINPQGTTVISGGDNLISVAQGFPALASDDVDNGTDPQIGALAANGGPSETHALTLGSPAVDAVEICNLYGTLDQRTVSRPQGERCDSGAFELEPVSVVEIPALGRLGWLLLAAGISAAAVRQLAGRPYGRRRVRRTPLEGVRMTRSLVSSALLLAFVAPPASAAAPASGQAIGTVRYKDKTVTLRHAYLIAGDNYGSKVRKVILSAVDIKDKIAGASSLMSAGAKLREGISFELDESVPFVGYWMAIADQSMQISAPLEPKLFATTASTPQRVAGKVSFDQSGSGGPKVEAEFDASLLKEFR